MELVETVAYMLIRDNHLLAEKRKLTKKLSPGLVLIPGGHVEEGETIEAALIREIEEELGVFTDDFDFVCALLDRAEEFLKLNYFVINSWQGELQNLEAEALIWIPLDALNQLGSEVDRLAVTEYMRVYGTSRSQ